MTDPAPQVYLVDAHGLIFQVFHAISGMTSPDGRPTNAVYGFARDLMDISESVRPDYLVCAFDLPGKTFRSDIFDAYKANRSEPPSDLILQLPLIQQVLQAMNIPSIGIPGYEADDVLATLADAADKAGMHVTICSSDKDCRQLIRDRVQLLNLRKKTRMDRAELLADWGVTPEQVVDFQALVGDKVDNVPGVPGIGEKTAAKLLQQFGSIDGIIQRIDELPKGKNRSNLEAAIASGAIHLSRQLTRLSTEVPIALEWDKWKRAEWDLPRLQSLFQELGFRSYAERIRGKLKSAGAAANATLLETAGIASRAVTKAKAASTAPAKATTPGLFDTDDSADAADHSVDVDFPFGALGPSTDTWGGNYRLINQLSDWSDFLAQLSQQSSFAFDLETTSLRFDEARIVGFAFCWNVGEAVYVPALAPLGEPTIPIDRLLTDLKPILENPKIGKRNQNIKFDANILARKGVTVRGIVGDSMVAHYLLHAGERSHNLDEMTRQYFQHENITIESLIGKGKKQLSMSEVPTEKIAEYAAEDADAAWRLCERLETELQSAGLDALYREVEIPLIEVLGRMESTGIRIDVPFLNRLSGEMAEQLETLEAEIHQLAGREFNIGSPKQLRQILFEEMKLPMQKRTDTTGEASTDQESLERLGALGYELPRKLIEHRQISKLKGTYVDALPKLVDLQTGRVHTSFNQTVAATGRLSSSDPNLQNIPTRTEQGKQLRQAFLPRDGWQLLTADYSQIELRMLAHYSGDPALRQAFLDDSDVHTRVAADIFKVPEAEVSSLQRRVAKTVNFGVIYGMSAHGLAARLGILRDEATGFIDAYFARYPQVLAYQDTLLANARKNGYVSTILGRRRRFDPSVIRPGSTFQQRNQAEREAINMEIQGSAADLMKLALLRVDEQLQREQRQSKMLLTVHDELVFEVPPDEIETMVGLVRNAMTTAMELTVPLHVDVSIGPNWLDTVDWPQSAGAP
ncbi:DNA polymerase I [Tuwongella immobilis]|uniref:DNA polymerase I n=1 Tax=Tuwongella immobilis TaxID=692036 RepID=A0A6C2YPW3_9BACT|nr:DNA polymerase I [Tuwongella immobilis]VIP03219.1 dna polymerase i : DNA polymerase I OS=Planctomyces limnophilus (strain ATCC 43296 / DSM 3776 / IFAM 1008 / 290) GN=Plim_3011 PE=3 SV=1: 5_3_exonuc_N: 5_3_exonuc: DNA_pol_A_exo1: DNA_pol_A [Tuwongella immobilis]VTS03744.1 dna polymerase i : DNA polymerase I OS=Planctomyces limnophilus (strain ATCC 43296 / DSM 3776 / IFAM 1008 / 290) GN=Plim_3011 PE=3 SV=1: 5_3_exonuc_N: 5_3_exonuc: DNA_pol_A_exo1: DNA_pol_A [Tuwongella immobilis]